jgi:hypothetical protein
MYPWLSHTLTTECMPSSHPFVLFRMADLARLLVALAIVRSLIVVADVASPRCLVEPRGQTSASRQPSPGTPGPVHNFGPTMTRDTPREVTFRHAVLPEV